MNHLTISIKNIKEIDQVDEYISVWSYLIFIITYW